ncbi:MAG: hypothetical protein P4L36_13155 [Holophaga sp.]|nr:hypothetical protein [Holophaga sp.]
MATILDAFYVTLGLNNEEFKKGESEAEKLYEQLVKEAKAAAKAITEAAKGKSVDEIAAARESAREVEAAGKKSARAIRDNMVKESKAAVAAVEEQTRKGKELFNGLKEAAVGFFGVAIALGGMVEFVKGTMEAEVNAGRLAKTLDVDVTELEALEGAVKTVGGTSEGMDASLKGLNSRLEMIAIHGPRSKMALQVFAGMGISAVALKGKDATQVMGLLAEKMEKMSGAKAMALGERLGLDEGTVRLLQKGKEGVAALTGEIKKHVASEEQIKQADKFEKSMKAMNASMAATGRDLMAVLMPALLGLAGALAKVATWARDHSGTVKVALGAIAAGFVFLSAGAIAAGVSMVGSWIASSIAAITASAAFIATGIAAAAAWVMALGPTTLIIAAIALVAGGLYLLVGHFKEVGHWANQTAYDIVFHFLKAFFMVEHAGARMWKALLAGAKEALGWIGNKLASIGNVVLKVSTLGMAGSTPQPAFAGAGASAGMAMRPSVNNRSSSTSTRETHVTIGTVTTKATDAQGLAAELPGAIKSQSSLVDMADGGMF